MNDTIICTVEYTLEGKKVLDCSFGSCQLCYNRNCPFNPF